MKIKTIVAGLVIVSSTFYAESKPGDTYTLTGKEKSIEGIVEADMKAYPKLYEGESLRQYVSKFTSENKIGRRKLSPGDKLLFPETRASKKVQAEARRRMLLGKWKAELKPNLYVTSWFKANGQYVYEMLKGNAEMDGIWEVTGDILRVQLDDMMLFGSKKKGSKKWVEHKIILITENELHTQLEDHDVIKYVRIK